MYSKSIKHYGTPRHSGRYPYGSGDRPFQSSGGSIFAKIRKKFGSSDKKKSTNKKTDIKTEKKKSIKEMSNSELKEHIERLELEKKLKSLQGEQISVGRKLANEALYNGAKNIGTQLATYAIGTGVNKLFGTEVVNPKKGQKDKK